MESYFIIILGILLFIEYGDDLRNQLQVVILKNFRGVMKYFGSVAVLSLVLSITPALFLSVYMRSKGFFAYEVFGGEKQGIQVLGLHIFVGYLITAVSLFLTFILVRIKADLTSTVLSGVVSLSIYLILIVSALSTKNYPLLIFSLSFILIIGVSIFYWVTSDFSEKARYWLWPLGLAVLLFVSPFVFNDGAVKFTENALSIMKVGGGMDVELSEPLGFSDARHDATYKAKLIFRTPEFYYLQPLKDMESVIIVSTEHVSLKYSTSSNAN